MRKHLIAMALFLGLLATAAGASAYTFEVAGNVDSSLRAQVTVNFYPQWGNMATFDILNTTTTQGVITGFAFSMPNNGAGVTGVISDPGAGTFPKPSFQLFNGGMVLPNSINVPQFSGNYDMGMGTGPNFSGGNPGGGIQMGELATFAMIFQGPGAAGWDMNSILAALNAEGGSPFAVRFQATTGGGSDVATPTPIPGAVWLLGSGLLGIMGFKRRRTA